jgi:hypothetical protein
VSDTQAAPALIAYVAWHGLVLHAEEPGRVVVTQPDWADLRNFFGTLRAGAIYTLAATATGVEADGRVVPNVVVTIPDPGGAAVFDGTLHHAMRSRSRNASHPAPPPQIRACGATAHGSCLGW